MLRLAKNRYDQYNKADQDNNGRYGDTAGAVYFIWIKHIGVCTTAASHQQKPNNHDGYACQHPELVLLVKQGSKTRRCSIFCWRGRGSLTFHEKNLKGQDNENWGMSNE